MAKKKKAVGPKKAAKKAGRTAAKKSTSKAAKKSAKKTKKPAKTKATRKSTKKTTKKVSSPKTASSKKKTVRKKVTKKTGSSKRAKKKTSKSTAKSKSTRKRQSTVRGADQTTRPKKQSKQASPQVKAARKPKRPRRTKQTVPPLRVVPPPVVDVDPLGPDALDEAEVAESVEIADDVEQVPAVVEFSPPLDAEILEPGAPPQAGDIAPDFELLDETGRMHTLSQYRGRRVVLYFYPKDDTPGCTREACGFRDALGQYRDRDAIVIGVSPDSVGSHQRFAAKFGLTFPLLADEDHAVAERYGVWVEKNRYGRQYMGIARTTFVIDAEGRVVRVFQDVKPDVHAAEVLDYL